GHACGRLAVRQREHDGIGAERREVFMRRRAVAQFTGVGRLERRHALARALARGHVGEIELRMPADQLDQLGAHVAARADDAHGLLAAHAWRSRRALRLRFTAGHSPSMIEKLTVSRTVPSRWRVWLRVMPSSFAPSRAIAAREARLKYDVCRPTDTQCIVSNACVSSNNFASVFNPVRCTLAAYHV